MLIKSLPFGATGQTSRLKRADDEQYLVRLIGQAIIVSLGTMNLVKALPKLEIEVTSCTYKSLKGSLHD